MSDHVVSPATSNQWSLDELLPDVPSRFDDIDLQLPQSVPDDSLHRSEEPWSPLLHDPIPPRTLNSMHKGLATVTRDDSQCSTIPRDSGYYSISGDSSAPSSLERHQHWCLICENRRPFLTCDGWKRHMNEHETKYHCLVCEPQKGPNDTNAPSFTRKSTLLNHLKRHGNLNYTVQVDSWRQTQRNKFYACGFCMALFGTSPEYLNHIDQQHYRYHETLEHWDGNKVILGLLQQPLVREAWQRILAANSLSEQLSFTWGKIVGSGVQHRLETSEEAPEALAMAALTTSENGSRQLELIPPITKHHDTAQRLSFGLEPLAVRLKQFPESFDDTKCNSPSQPRSHDHLASVSCSERQSLQDGSEQDPWDPLRIHEGKTLPIMNHDANYGAPGSIHQGDMDYHSAETTRIQSLAEVQASGVVSGTAMLTDSARRSFLSQTSSFSSSNQTVATLHSLNPLNRNADDVVQTYEGATSEQSSVSAAELRDKCSTAAEKTAIKLEPLMRNCRVCQERDVQVSPSDEG